MNHINGQMETGKKVLSNLASIVLAARQKETAAADLANYGCHAEMLGVESAWPHHHTMETNHVTA